MSALLKLITGTLCSRILGFLRDIVFFAVLVFCAWTGTILQKVPEISSKRMTVILFLIKSVEMDSQIASHGCFDILIHTVEALFEEPGIEAADDILLGVKVTIICGSVHSCFFRDLTDGDTVVIF